MSIEKQDKMKVFCVINFFDVISVLRNINPITSINLFIAQSKINNISLSVGFLTKLTRITISFIAVIFVNCSKFSIPELLFSKSI